MKDGRIGITGEMLEDGFAISESLPQAKCVDRFARIVIYGSEVIEKEVRESGTSGRVYLPRAWRGHRVKVVRID